MKNTNDQDTLLPILKDAISLEIYGQEYYSIFSDLVPDANAKAMFRRLSRDEGEHREILEKEYTKISGKSIDIRIVSEENRDNARHIFPEPLKPMNVHETMDVLTLGIRTEERSIEFYARSAQHTENESGRELFLKLVGIEEGHRDILEKARRHLEQEGSWAGYSPSGH